MTLSERNTFFKVGIVFCAVCTLLIIVVSFFTIPHYRNFLGTNYIIYQENDFFPDDDMEQETDNTASQGTDHAHQGIINSVEVEDDNQNSTRRPSGVFQAITGSILGNNYYSVHITLILLVIFSLAGILLIHHFFERTSAPEILYIAIFTISFSFEVIRLILPLHLIFNFPLIYVLVASRILLFARVFGIFSLFAASICSAGLDVQKTRNIIIVLIIATQVIIMGVPIDVLNWDTSFNMKSGYNSMFRMIEIGVFFTTMISFLITAKIRESKEYAFVALGIILALAGRSILLSADNWISPLPGIFLLSYGTWFLCSKLHRINLWL